MHTTEIYALRNIDPRSFNNLSGIIIQGVRFYLTNIYFHNNAIEDVLKWSNPTT